MAKHLINPPELSVAPILAAFVGDARPAVTGVGVASLASPETLVEVEAVASVAAPPGDAARLSCVRARTSRRRA